MPSTTLTLRPILFVGKSELDHGILDQLNSYCQPDPHWVEAAPQAIAAIHEQDWSLCLIQLDPDPHAALVSAATITKATAKSGRASPPCIGITATLASNLDPLRSASGLDAILSLPCETQIWASWLADPVAFDPDELIDRMMGNEILAKRVVGVFLEDAPRQLMALHDALIRQDPESGSRIAHSLRGAASNAGGDALVSLAKGIENASGEGHFEEVERMLPKLEERFARLRPVLERFCR
jgi:HPt (histidine-containing phosphotransfer) domain-containing protein